MSIEALDMVQIRWHSRGGQGGMTASQLLAESGFQEGKDTTAFSFYGAERRGAPVSSFNRVANSPVKLYSKVTNPDLVIVLDDSLLEMADVTKGLDSSGTIIINSNNEKSVGFDGRKFIVDATNIAMDFDLQTEGAPIVNTPMLGALAHTDVVNIESVVSVIKERFDEKNAQAARKAYNKTKEV